MSTTTAGVAGFTGVLVGRQYQRGQKYVQLVFQTREGRRLSLSRNAQMVRSLTPGNVYAVRGQERSIGARRYIYEPTTRLIETQRAQPAVYQEAEEQQVQAPSFIKRHVRVVSTVAALLVVTTAVSVSALVKHGAAPTANANNANAAAAQSDSSSINLNGEVKGASTTTENQTDPPATDGTSQAAVTTSTTPTTQPKKTTTTTPQVTSQSTVSVVSDPPADPPPPIEEQTPPPVDQTPPPPDIPPADQTPPPSDTTTTP